MILRHEGTLDWAIGRKVKMLLSLRKEFPAGNIWVTATPQDDDTRIADIDKIPGIDIPSGETGRVAGVVTLKIERPTRECY
jgi:hypothetical protein